MLNYNKGYYLYMNIKTGILFASSRKSKSGVIVFDDPSGRYFLCVGKV